MYLRFGRRCFDMETQRLSDKCIGSPNKNLRKKVEILLKMENMRLGKSLASVSQKKADLKWSLYGVDLKNCML
jgi:hypothetical protein